MRFSTPLVPGRLIQRYKRFLADVLLDSGETITEHCANPGAMLGLAAPGNRVWLSKSANPARQLAYSWEIVEAERARILAQRAWWPRLKARLSLRSLLRRPQRDPDRRSPLRG